MIQMEPIGIVHSQKKWGAQHYPVMRPAQIEINPLYQSALTRLEEYSHIWVICWYEPQKPYANQVFASYAHTSEDVFGALALRTPCHPNPIALSASKLLRIEDNTLFVEDLDAYDGTAVLDIKPYYRYDLLCSAQMPNIRHSNQEHEKSSLCQIALAQHGETCRDLALAVQMALLAEQAGFLLTDQGVSLWVQGSPCLLDCLQGLCLARFANPSRLHYQPHEKPGCRFISPGQQLTITVLPGVPTVYAEILQAQPEQLFEYCLQK